MNIMKKGLANQYNKLLIFEENSLYFVKEPKFL